MPQLTPLPLDDGTTIYIEARPSAAAVTSNPDPRLDFLTETPEADPDRGIGQSVRQGIQTLEQTVRGYTLYLLKSFQNFATAEVSEVTFEFGVNIGAGADIPYIASGSSDCNVKISVTCTFPSASEDI